ncbi:hypothetical protein ACN47E_003353 [Coniothyrium glycines]
MATSMFADFSAPERRKKVVTYGRSARLPSFAKTASTSPEEQASPERPQKRVAAAGQLKTATTFSRTFALSAPRDPFDVPSEDEFSTPAPKSVRRLTSKRSIPAESFDVPESGDDMSEARPPKKIVQPLRKPVLKRAAVPDTKASQMEVRTKAQPVPASSSDPSASESQRTKTRQPTSRAGQRTMDVSHIGSRTAHSKNASRAATPAVPSPKAVISRKGYNLNGHTSSSEVHTKQATRSDVFDVPMSDEDASVPTPKPHRRVPVASAKERARDSHLLKTDAQRRTTDSDDSTTSRKRKRVELPSRALTTTHPAERRQEHSVQRSGKQQKHGENVFVNSELSEGSSAQLSHPKSKTALSGKKPHRSGQRTVPVLKRPTMAKGESSPANLSRMLPYDKAFKQSHQPELPEVASLEDETMYEIPEPNATPARTPRTANSGSVTPRQKSLFNDLLGTPSSATPIPSIQALQLTDRKPRSLLGALSRSKSDLTHDSHTRKTKLISTLRRGESSSENEDEDSASDSDEDNTEIIRNDHVSEQPRAVLEIAKSPMTVALNDASNTDSQTSQATSGSIARPRFTYAKCRSYLEESNPEDALLMSMDLDDNIGFNSQGGGISEEEDDPSQARAYHELKRQGQQALFNDDAQMLVEDISRDKSTSIRRSAMMDLATKMEAASFTSQLLDSPWAQSLTKNVSYQGDVLFDFSSAIATIYILRSNPTSTIMDELLNKEVVDKLTKLLDNDLEVKKIAKDRKTNMSRISQQSVGLFRDLVERSIDWCPKALDKVSPQIAALKALDSLFVSLQTNETVGSVLDHEAFVRLIELLNRQCKILGSGSLSTHDSVVLGLVLSIIHTVSATTKAQHVWAPRDLLSLAEAMPAIFQHGDSPSAMLAVKICMNLTNNKPKACQSFSGRSFVQSLTSTTIRRFELLQSSLLDEQREEMVDNIILNLGTMINLAEFSDKVRVNVDDGRGMIGALVAIFVEGSKRAKAKSLVESHFSVAIGYLGVLLGNLCLNKTVRAKIQTAMPGQQLDLIVNKIKEFIQFHEHVDNKAKQDDRADSQEIWQNYTARIMHVVENLETMKT